jgi:hypothetical protein
LQRQYEDLRQQALAPNSSNRGLGWALLVRQGMAAWRQAMLKPAAEPEASLAVSGPDRPAIPRQEFVLALVALVLGRRAEVTHG